MDAQISKKLSPKILDFCKILKINEKIWLDLRTLLFLFYIAHGIFVKGEYILQPRLTFFQLFHWTFNCCELVWIICVKCFIVFADKKISPKDTEKDTSEINNTEAQLALLGGKILFCNGWGAFPPV